MDTMITTTFRKTKAGEWVVCGPTAIVQPGATVEVAKRDGSTKTVIIAHTGSTFSLDGTDCCYGHIAPGSERKQRRAECTECGLHGPAGMACNQCYEGHYS